MKKIRVRGRLQGRDFTYSFFFVIFRYFSLLSFLPVRRDRTVILLQEVKPSLDSKMIKLPTFNTLFLPTRHFR